MKKLLFMLMAALLLVGCGNGSSKNVAKEEKIEAHENISKEVIDDVNRITLLVGKAVEKNTVPIEGSFDSFTDKYAVDLDYVNNEEFELVMATSLLMFNLEGYLDGSQDYPGDLDRLHKTMETGKYQRLTKPNKDYEDFYDGVAKTFYEEDMEIAEEVESEPEPEVIEEAIEEEIVEETDDTQENIDTIDYLVNKVVNEDLKDTSITNLRINEDVSVDEERYIILVDLEWGVKNKPKMTKEMLDMYSDHLAAKIADNKLVYELVLFWTVPYHNEDDSILKRTYQNKGDGMYLEDEMKDISIFD